MNNEDKGYTIFCPRCGAEMNSKSRYCMKCGYLNTDHAANESMKPYIKENSESYQVGSGNIMSGNGLQTAIGNNTGNKKLCFAVNFSIYMIIMIISFLLTTGFQFDILVIRDSLFPIISIVLSIIYLYIYSVELIFMKLNKPWWIGLIPVYNSMVLTEVLFQKKWLGILVLVPVIGEIILLVIIYTLGKRFKFNGLLTVLLSFIYMPVIGFGTSLYLDRAYVDNLSQIEVEKNYKRKRVFLFFIILFFLIGVGLLVWKNMDSVEKGGEMLGNSYYSYAGKKIVKETKKSIDNGKVVCESGPYYENTGVYYFEYSDIGDYVYLPLYLQRELIAGYVKVDNSTGKSKYYVSLSDGKKGFDETLYKDLDSSIVTNYTKLKDVDGLGNNCIIK